MPYNHRKDLPESVRHLLPKHGQEIYRAAYNSTWEEYKDPKDRYGDTSREEVAHKVAWSAVKNVYMKNDNDNWVKKDK